MSLSTHVKAAALVLVLGTAACATPEGTEDAPAAERDLTSGGGELRVHGTGLNRFCEPSDTVYPGGTPLFDEATGKTTPLADYVAAKGLNTFCDPAGTVYPGGTPLFDETTGVTITREAYLLAKFVIF